MKTKEEIELNKIALDIQDSILEMDSDYRLITDDGILRIVSEYGLGETEFHTADIERLIRQKQLIEKQFKELKEERNTLIEVLKEVKEHCSGIDMWDTGMFIEIELKKIMG